MGEAWGFEHFEQVSLDELERLCWFEVGMVYAPSTLISRLELHDVG